MRCLFNTTAKDVRRFRLYEKSLDALATSPYAKAVDRWLLAGASHYRPWQIHIPPRLLASHLMLIQADSSCWWSGLADD